MPTVGPACPDRRELRGQAGDVELVEVLRPRDVLEHEGPELAGRDAVGQVVHGQLVGRGRQDDLAAVADRRHPGRATDLDPAVVVAGEVGFAAVEAHPDAELCVVRPVVRRQRALRVDGRGHGRAGLLERREDGVALGPDDRPAPARRRRRGSARGARR